MGIKLKKDRSNRGKFIKLFPAIASTVAKKAGKADPALFWDKYSCSAFASVPQLQTSNPEFEALSRYSLKNIKNTMSGAIGSEIGTYVEFAFPDTNFGIVEGEEVITGPAGNSGGAINWLANAKILGLVSTSHKIKWTARYYISDAELPEAYSFLDVGSGAVTNLELSWTDDNYLMYEAMRTNFYPDGIDLFKEDQKYLLVRYVNEYNNESVEHIYLAHLGIHTCYNRAWISFPQSMRGWHDNSGFPTILSGTLHLSATVDGASAGTITFDLLRLLSGGDGCGA